MAKLKGFDVKALLLNHGEKIGVGLVALLGLTGLATASWMPSVRQPKELKLVAEETRSTWLQNKFTEDKRAAFDVDTPDVLAKAARMQAETEDLDRFSISNQWNPPIHPVRERRGAVVVLAPTNPEANPIAIVMAEKPDVADAEVEETTDPKKTKDKKKPEVSDEAKDIFGQAATGSGLAGPGGAVGPGASPGSVAALRGITIGGGGGGGGGMGGGRRDRDDEEIGYGEGGYGNRGYSDYGGTASTSVERKVRYHSGVSVRLIFPLVEQIRSMSKSLHLPENDSRVTLAIDFVDFQIERKKAVPGAEPWSGEWESLSTEEIGEILEKSLAFDLDVVNPSVTRSELTMPLPRRAVGKWTPKDASHKLLDEFKLDPIEQQLVDRFQAKLLEEAENRKKMMPKQTVKGGFTKYMLNSSDLNNAVADTATLTDEMFTELSDNKNPENKSKYDDKEELRKLINKSMSTGRVLLVRFMDFSCDRGNAYIYRVRLQMKNPNFNYSLDELEQPELATQATIFSDWSEPTAPAFVPQSYRYYAQHADNPQSVKIGMYFENEKTGTPAMANLEVRAGSRIGGKADVEVVDLSKSVREAQSVEFKSPDLLASITPSIRLNSAESPELKSHIDAMRGHHKPLADRITVIDSNGAIITRYVGDFVANGGLRSTEDLDSKFYQDILKLYEHLKRGADDAGIYSQGRGAEDGGPSIGGYGGGMGEGSSLSGGGLNQRKSGRAR